MAFIPIPNGMTLCFHFVTDTSNWQFCLTLRKSAGAPTSTDLSNVATIASNWWTDELKTAINVNTVLDEIIVTDQTSQGAPQVIEVIAEAGESTGAGLPASNAMVVSLRTAKRGRSYRGRPYLSGWGTAVFVNENFWASSHTAYVLAAFNTLQSDLDTGGYDIVVASKQHNGVVTNPAEVNEVTSMIIDAAIDSQRRRLAGRGT